MTFENDNSFDGTSPDKSRMSEPDTYEDLLGVNVPVEDFDIPMPDLHDEHAEMFHTPPIANMMQQGQTSDQRAEQRSPKSVMMDFSALNANLLGISANSAKNLLGTSRPKQAIIKIKKEPLDTPFTSGIATNTKEDPVEISDTEDPDSIFKHGTKMSDGVIILSDNEDLEEIDVFDCEPASIAIKTEKPDAEWSEVTRGSIEASDAENDKPSTAPAPNLSKSFLRPRRPKGKRTSTDIEQMQKIQRLLAEKALGKTIGSGAKGALVAPKVLQSSGVDSTSPSSGDENAWTKVGEASDEDTGRKFKDLRRMYKIKAKTNSNTYQDEMDYGKAERAENIRRHNLKVQFEEALGAGDTDDSEKDEEGLFVTPSPKRRRISANEGDDTIGVKNPASRGSKKRKSSGEVKRSQEELDEDRTANMMAGIETFLGKKKFTREDQAGSSEEQAQQTSAKSSESSKGKKSGPKTSNRNANGHRNGIGHQLASNVFDDATVNNDRDALPVSSETVKRKVMKAIIASVPLENKREAKDDEKAILKATSTLAPRKVHPDGQGGWKLQGMASSLHNHQVLAANWMKCRETAGQPPLGGILADGMGLGKTLMTLATMVANPPSPKEINRCTLIVCTPGLLGQWEREIKKHLAPGVLTNVLKHHSISRISGNGAMSTLERADIVLTTYGEVVKSYPKPEVPEGISTREDLLKWWDQLWDENRDTLHRVNFYRVVLDEAQAIKNHVTATSIACRALMAKHRWSLSGTPIMNSVDELYPYFKFLRIPYTGRFKDFEDNYCIPGDSDCNKRLHCLLDQFMLRRTFKDSLLGAPIVKLPKFNQRTIDLKFNSVEYHIYQIVHRRFVGMLNKASAEGRLEKQPGMGFVAFLRLRQLAAHIFLAQEVLQSIFEEVRQVDNLERVTIQNTTPENKPERELIAALRRMVAAKEKAARDAPKARGTFDINAPRLTNLVAQFGKFLRELKTKKKWSQHHQRTLCQRCGEPPADPFVTDCLHVYCEECLQSMAYDAAAKGHDHTACMQCETIYTKSESCSGLKELEFDDFAMLSETKTKNGKVNMEWVSYDDNLVLSAKTTAVRTQVEKWLREEPDKKIIIFSQFHMIMQILEGICEKQGWKYCTYHGKLSHKAREKTISEFDTNPETKVMIASLKCGGTGLNLTMASKVICIDLWFNSCIEQQAFCRVFRIGQTSETWITRYIVEKSADEKLMNMQVRKNALIGAAMDDKDMMSKLTVEEIMRLFGEVRFDKNKKPFIAMNDNEKLDSILK